MADMRRPIFQGLLPFERARIPTDIIAGMTLAALAIPEVMGYAKIAGMPVVTGLYTILIPLAVYALLGSSRHLVVGADSATAAIMAAGLAGLAAAGSSDYVALAGLLALLAGGFLLLARLLRLGFLADFLSRTVLIGFLTGVGIQVACGQFSSLFGIPRSGGRPVQQIVDTFRRSGDLSTSTFAVSALVLLVLVAGGRLLPRVPWALIAVIATIAASATLDLAAHGVTTLGIVPGGLPDFGLPPIGSHDAAKLLGTVVSIFIVVLAQSAATSRAYAARYSDDFDENVDLVGLGLSNVAAGLTGAFVVNGSPTKTEMVDSAGGRSQLAQLTTVGVVLVVLLLLTRPLSYMPVAVLAAVVFLIGVKLVDVKGMTLIYRRRPWEFAVALITAAVVVLVGVQQGIVLAIVLSVVIHLRHSYRPHDTLLVRSQTGAWTMTEPAGGAEALPGLIVYHFGASLYYANAGRFAEEVLSLARRVTPPPSWFCISADAVGDIDFTGSAVLRAVNESLRERDITLVFCELHAEVRAELERDGLAELIGEEHLLATLDDVVAAFRATGHTKRGGKPPA